MPARGAQCAKPSTAQGSDYSALRWRPKTALLREPYPGSLGPAGESGSEARLSRTLYLIGGFLALGLGGVGVVLPLLPTVPFIILAAFCFARSNKALELWLLEHPAFGTHIRLWRERGAISRRGKRAALAAFTASTLFALIFAPLPWSLAPLAAALIGGTWIWTRPEA